VRVTVAGGSGLIGRRVVAKLRESGHEVHVLGRGQVPMPGNIAWDPSEGIIPEADLARADAVVNLTGAPIAAGRWTARRRAEIRSSRLDATHAIVQAWRSVPPRPRVLVNASATGYYGDCGESWVDETQEPGRGFLAEVCTEWEAEAWRAAELGARVVGLRFGVVLAAEGGALARMLPAFRRGLGGPMGGGRQWMSWVSLADAAGAVVLALADSEIRGAVNVVAPGVVRQLDFARILGGVLGRPAGMPIPALLLRTIYGEMARETLLASVRCRPSRLLEAGFRFCGPDLEGALRQELAPSSSRGARA